MSDVGLRDVRIEDLETLYEQQLDPEALRMAAYPARDREAFFEHWRTKVLEDSTVVVQAIVEDDRLAGYIASFNKHGVRLVGFWLGRRFWGRGIASRALAAFLRRFREPLLHARVARQNPASLRVLEKCGFTKLHEQTDANGVTIDVMTLGADESQGA